MFIFKREAELVTDREDLLTVLQMRFGSVPSNVILKIYDISDFHTLQRLILVAANTDSFNTFLEELHADEQSFRIVGDSFQPLSQERSIRDGKENESSSSFS